MRHQRGIPGEHRERVEGRVEGAVRRRVETLALRHDCSMSFVVNTVLADAFGINMEVRYDSDDKQARNRKTRRHTNAGKKRKRA